MARVEVVYSGFGGQGIVLAGQITGIASAIYDQKESSFIPNYGPEARGGACRAEIVIDEKKIGYPYTSKSDVLIVMSQESYSRFLSLLKEGGILIYDSDLVKIDGKAGKFRVYSVGFTRIAEEMGKKIVANIVMLGAFTAITGIVSYDAMKKAIAENVPQRFVDINMKAFDRGYESGKALAGGDKK